MSGTVELAGSYVRRSFAVAAGDRGDDDDCGNL